MKMFMNEAPYQCCLSAMKDCVIELLTMLSLMTTEGLSLLYLPVFLLNERFKLGVNDALALLDAGFGAVKVLPVLCEPIPFILA